MREIRRATEADLPAIRELAVLAFNVPPSWARDDGPKDRADLYLCAFENGRLAATTRDIPMRQWFGGVALPAAGISSVAVVPELRGTGVGDELMRRLLADARARGAVVSSLFPATVPFYRRLGYEYGGTWNIHETRLEDLPRAAPELAVAELDPERDLDGVRACYESFAAGRPGLIEGEGTGWWRNRVLTSWRRDRASRAVVVRGAGGVEGYAAFVLSTRGEWEGFDVECTHLVAVTPGALRALLGYFGRYRGVGRSLVWAGAANEPLGLLVDEETIEIRRRMRWMVRILDVHAALESRGYPTQLTGEAVVTVDDPMFEENRGSFRIAVDAGKPRVERSDEPGVALGIGALSALFTGYLSPGDLRSVGSLEHGDDDAVSFLAALFAGPEPWLIDHF